MPMFQLLSSEVSQYQPITEGLKTAFQGLVTDTLGMIAAVLPVAITIYGAFMLVAYGKKVFAKISGSKG